MKRLMLIGVILLTATGVIQAKSSGGQSAKSTTNTSEGNNKKSKKKKTALNHRRNYNWKSGQQATPTGQEATGMGSGYQSGKKDTAGKRED